MEKPFKNPMRKIITWTAVVYFLLLLIYVFVKYSESLYPEFAGGGLSAKLEHIAQTLWIFVSPILQVALILLIVEWILFKLGIDFTSTQKNLKWNVQTIIAVVVIGTFAIAALTNLDRGLDYLKDLSLVVVGFYFGSQKKKPETSDEVPKDTE